MKFAPLHQDDRLIGSDDVGQMVDCAPRVVMQRVKRGEMPKPVYGNGSVRSWRASDIQLWIELGCPGVERFEQERDQRVSQRERQLTTEFRRAVREAVESLGLERLVAAPEEITT